MEQSHDYDPIETESPEKMITDCKTLQELASVILILPELKNSHGDILDTNKIAVQISEFAKQIDLWPRTVASMNADKERLDEFERSLTRTYGIREKVFQLAGLKLEEE